MKGLFLKKGLNGNVLKIIALLSMTFDHVGALMFPDLNIFRIIGRVAMPIFAFMIAEGCVYSRHRAKYFALVFGLGFICILGYFFAEKRLLLNILITFSFSIATIYAIDYATTAKSAAAYLLPVFAVSLSAFVNFCLPQITGNIGWEADYGFFGTMLPVAVYLFKDFRLKVVATVLGLAVIALYYGDVQWWSFTAVPILALYDGTRGKVNLKYLFYIYYPLHLVVIYGIYYFICI